MRLYHANHSRRFHTLVTNILGIGEPSRENGELSSGGSREETLLSLRLLQFSHVFLFNVPDCVAQSRVPYGVRSCVCVHGREIEEIALACRDGLKGSTA